MAGSPTSWASSSIPSATPSTARDFSSAQKTGAPLTFNPLAFLKANPPAYAFHLAIWKWFSDQVSAQK